MKIYFGRIPKAPFISLDSGLFLDYLKSSDYSFTKAVTRFLEENSDNKIVYHTINPLIPNFMDDDCIEYFHIIDELGNDISLETDEKMNMRLDYMGLGEALSEDYRCFNT